MAKPFFIVGLARSGTNLLARMMSRHPQTSVALDPFMPVFRSLRDAVVRQCSDGRIRRRYPPGLPFQDYYFDLHAPVLLDAMLSADLGMALNEGEIEQLRKACAERATLESSSLGVCMAGLSGRTYSELLDSMFAVLSEYRPEAEWVGCKEVWIEDFIPLLARALPASRFIGIERDPRAIVASLLAVSAADSSQAAHAPSYMRHWRKGIALNRRYQNDSALSKRIHLTSYESIVSDPEGNARALSKFLSIDYHPAMIALSEDGWTGNSGYEHEGRDVYAGSLNRWRTKLSPDITAAIDYLCGPEMRLTNYVPVSPLRLGPDIVTYLLHAGHEIGSWRSDSGDDFIDLSGEVLRHALLHADLIESNSLLRRCFLFPETYQAIRQADRKGLPQ